MLGVAAPPTDQEIKSAYRKLAMQYHPDRNPDNPDAEEQFKECSEAYAILADAEKRARYDRFGHAGVAEQGRRRRRSIRSLELHRFPGHLRRHLWRHVRRPARWSGASRAQRGADMREDLTLEFEEAVFGVTKQVQIRRLEECEQCKGSGAAPGKAPITCTTCDGHGQVRYQQGFFAIARTCSTCQGSGKLIVDPCSKCKGQARVRRERTVTVKVPAGVDDGARMLYSNEGEAGVYGGPPGDLYVVLHCKEHEFFEREGKDLHCVVPISVVQAALGTEISVPTLEGEHVLKVPEGTQTGTTFKLRNKGVPELNGRGRGDLYVELKVQTPTKLSKQQRELLQELQGTLSVENKPVSRTLLGKMKDIFS